MLYSSVYFCWVWHLWVIIQLWNLWIGCCGINLACQAVRWTAPGRSTCPPQRRHSGATSTLTDLFITMDKPPSVMSNTLTSCPDLLWHHFHRWMQLPTTSGLPLSHWIVRNRFPIHADASDLEEAAKADQQEVRGVAGVGVVNTQ